VASRPSANVRFRPIPDIQAERLAKSLLSRQVSDAVLKPQADRQTFEPVTKAADEQRLPEQTRSSCIKMLFFAAYAKPEPLA
jgi:hypothetical protein